MIKEQVSPHIFSFEPHWGLTHASCWCFPQACSKADKILRHTPSDILQICCLGCCTAVPNAAASWTLRMASWEDGNAFHFSSELLWRFVKVAVRLLLHLRGIPTFEQVPVFSAGLWADAVFQQLQMETSNVCCHFSFNVDAFLQKGIAEQPLLVECLH